MVGEYKSGRHVLFLLRGNPHYFDGLCVLRSTDFVLFVCPERRHIHYIWRQGSYFVIFPLFQITHSVYVLCIAPCSEVLIFCCFVNKMFYTNDLFLLYSVHNIYCGIFCVQWAPRKSLCLILLSYLNIYYWSHILFWLLSKVDRLWHTPRWHSLIGSGHTKGHPNIVQTTVTSHRDATPAPE